MGVDLAGLENLPGFLWGDKDGDKVCVKLRI